MMSWLDRFIEMIITIVLIIGGYQFYFWAQRQSWFAPSYLETRLDAKIKFDPRWVWVYSGLYYPMIVLAAFSTPDWHSFIYSVACFLALLTVQMQFFLFMPVAIPTEWRDRARVSGRKYPRSMRFLEYVWSFDKFRNSMPSMHVSMATMVDLTIWSNWPLAGYVGGLFPLLIAASALKTKQHYVVDVIPGALLGAAVFFGWRYFIV